MIKITCYYKNRKNILQGGRHNEKAKTTNNYYAGCNYGYNSYAGIIRCSKEN